MRITLQLNDKTPMAEAARVAAARRGATLPSYLLEALKILVHHDAEHDKAIYHALYEKGYSPGQLRYRRRKYKRLKSIDPKTARPRRGPLDPHEKHPLRPQKAS